MIYQMSRSIVHKFCGTSKLDMDTLIYGCESLLSTVINITLILSIAAFSGNFTNMVIFMIFFGLLRLSGGGHFAPNHFVCFFIYIMMGFSGIFIGIYMPEHFMIPYLILVGAVSVILVYKFAPLSCENRPFSSEEYSIFKKRSRYMIFVLLALILVLTVLNNDIAVIAMNGVFIESLTLISFRKKAYE